MYPTLGLMAILLCPHVGPAPRAESDPALKELVALREDAIDAINKGDLDRLLTHVDADVVLTAPNEEPGKELITGKEGVRDYFQRMIGGGKHPGRAKSVTVELKVDGRRVLEGGGRAIAWGTSKDTYHMKNGSTFVMQTRWSGTLAKKDGKWLIVEFHISANPFDNAIQREIMRGAALWYGGTAGGVALIAGLLIGWMAGRRGSPPANAPSKV
jgi:hypothetical protein